MKSILISKAYNPKTDLTALPVVLTNHAGTRMLDAIVPTRHGLVRASAFISAPLSNGQLQMILGSKTFVLYREPFPERTLAAAARKFADQCAATLAAKG